jgi:hypothetical protein
MHYAVAEGGCSIPAHRPVDVAAPCLEAPRANTSPKRIAICSRGRPRSGALQMRLPPRWPERRKCGRSGCSAQYHARSSVKFPASNLFATTGSRSCTNATISILRSGSIVDDLVTLKRLRSQAVADLFTNTGIGVAQHQVEIFLFGDGWHDYRGRLCTYGQCPKGKRDCLAPECGRELFLQQHEGFVLASSAFATAIPLYERGRSSWLAVP